MLGEMALAGPDGPVRGDFTASHDATAKQVRPLLQHSSFQPRFDERCMHHSSEEVPARM
jgi:hypothetical protein